MFCKDTRYVVAKNYSTNECLLLVSRTSSFLFRGILLGDKINNSHSELRISSQAVELLRGVLFPTCGGCLSETSCDFIKCSPLGLWHFKVGEHEEQQQKHGENDEDVRATQRLWRDMRHGEKGRESKRKERQIELLVQSQQVQQSDSKKRIPP